MTGTGDRDSATRNQTLAPVRLSVVVTIVDGGNALERCLGALAAQDSPPSMEVLVPCGAGSSEVGEIRDRYPDVRWIETKGAPAEGDEGERHALYDRRRSAGLAAAGGEIVAILEDRSVPDPDWAQAIDRRHGRPDWVIGGAIRNGVDLPLNRAVFLCDFGRYEPPVAEGPVSWVSDVNVSYKREAVEATRELWRERYHETTVHWALQRMGHRPFLAPDVLVTQVRDDLTLRRLLAERYHWGRLFACTRAREGGPSRRLAYALASPLIPLVMFSRLFALQARNSRLGSFLRVKPVVFLLLVAWGAGEAVGYLTGRP